MQSRWSDAEAQRFIDTYAEAGEDLALRVYTSRLLGADADLVMHGGGNTSVKSRHVDLCGDASEIICVKGSGWNLDSIEPAGLPAMRLEPLRRLRALEALGDEQMVNAQRTQLIDASSPNPSVETLLHAFLSPKFIDHSHADAILGVTNRTDWEASVAEVFGDRVGVVPYVMPGFALAQRAAEIFEANPNAEGLVLAQHGLFTYGETAKESYERHIALVTLAEAWLEKKRSRKLTVAFAGKNDPQSDAAQLVPLLRGALAQATGDPDRPHKRMILEWDGSDEVRAFVDSEPLEALSQTGTLTPDHVIRTKEKPMIVGRPNEESEAGWREAIEKATEKFAEDYREYFRKGVEAKGEKTMLDPLPRVALVPGVGMFTAGASRKDARIAADIYRHTIRTKSLVYAGGEYQALPSLDLFDLEYWSLEQAKLGKGTEKPLARQVALITGAAGAIGAGVAEAVLEAGAHVLLCDMNETLLEETAQRLQQRFGGAAVDWTAMDVTDESSTQRAFDAACRKFGGVDLVVPNAGIAYSRPIDEIALDDWKRVNAVNAEGAFLTVREAMRLMKRQKTGGNIVVVSSKNVFSPGPQFAAYSASKASAHQLGKIAAMESAPEGIRVNMLNPDAVFGDVKNPSGLWATVGPDRAKARGLDPNKLSDYYRDRNLLKVLPTARHVGAAVVFFASNLTPTTGATLPIDGGLADGFPR